MGQVLSAPSAAVPYNVDPKRFSFQKFECCVNEGDQTSTGPHLAPISSTVLVHAECNKNTQRLRATRTDQRPLTFVQDPESGEIVLQLPYQPSLSLRFCLSIALIPGNEQHRLVFAHAASNKELQHIIESRQVGNWIEVGTWTEPRHPVIEKFDFLFVWDASEDRHGGQPIHFAFFFDSSPAPRLAIGATLWVCERPTTELSMLYEPTQNPQLQTPIASSTPADSLDPPPPALTSSPGPTPLSPGKMHALFSSSNNAARTSENEPGNKQGLLQNGPLQNGLLQNGPLPGSTATLIASNSSASNSTASNSTNSPASIASPIAIPAQQLPGPASVISPASPALATSAAFASVSAPAPISASAPVSASAPASAPISNAAPISNTTVPGTPLSMGGARQNMPYGMPLPSSSLPLALRPGPEHVFLPEDGPRFRSALVNMEKRMPALRARVKQLLKRTLMSRERLEALIEADQWLASALQDAARHECASFEPVVDWFSRSSEGGLSSVQRQRKVTLNELTTRLIEPLQRFYEYDIKPFEQHKRDFEEESNQFYSWTSRYLANRKDGKRGKAGEKADVKFNMKKRAFDVARFDYFNYMNELTIGLKQQILVQLMALATQSLTDSHIALGSEMSSRTQPRVDAAVEDIKKAAREWENYRLESLHFRKKLTEHFASDAEEVAKYIDRQGSPELGGGNLARGATAASALSSKVPKNYKEGLLWASSRPGGHQDSQNTNKQALQSLKWHKYWVVLDGTSLREYTNWKQSVVDLHNEPINLLVAGVREARSNDRRFCFEVVTPQYKRVYQATCEDDVRAWIAAINKSISTLLEASDDLPSPQIRENDTDYISSPTTSGAANLLQAISGAAANTGNNNSGGSNGSGSSGSGSGSGNGKGSGNGSGSGNNNINGGGNGVGGNNNNGSGSLGSGSHGTTAGSGSTMNSSNNNCPNSDHIGNGKHSRGNFHANNPNKNSTIANVSTLKPGQQQQPSTIDMTINSGLAKITAGYTNAGGGGKNSSNESLEKKSHGHNEDRLDKFANTFSIKGSSGQRYDRPRVPPINTALPHSGNPISPSVPLIRSPHMNYDPSQDDLIRAVHRIPSNRVCAECRSTHNVEWVSINLLVVICIECSGAHRSLGSHISKVRSLTLDTGAFTPSLKAAIFSVSNEIINNIWEENLPPNRRFASDASGQARKKFVTEKYVEKQFIQELEKPNTVLRRAIKEQNIPLICAALASRANPNGVSDADEPMLIHALRSAAPTDKTFPAAEVLIKNGAAVPPLGVYIGLSPFAESYLESKQSVV